MVSDEQDGKTISLEGITGSIVAPHPFRLLDVSVGDDEGNITSFNIRVIYGTLAGAAPDGMSPGDDPPYIISGLTGDGYIWGGISRDADTGEITSRYIDHGPSIPVDTETDGYIEFGSFSIDGEVMTIAQAVSGSLAYKYCYGHEWGLI